MLSAAANRLSDSVQHIFVLLIRVMRELNIDNVWDSIFACTV
jgi:hypothetical protein